MSEINVVSVRYGMPQELWIDFGTYCDSVTQLMKMQQEKWQKTVAFRSVEEFKKQYESAILAILWDKIIGNGAIVSTVQVPDGIISVWWQDFLVGEMESFVVDPMYEAHAIWKEINRLRNESEAIGMKYAVVIGATLNPKVVSMMVKHLWYENLGKVSDSFYREGKWFFVDSWRMSSEEFDMNAKMIVRFNYSFSDIEKNEIKQILLQS